MFELVILFMTGLFVGFVAAMSPGPDSLVVLSAATTGGRLAGVRAACGIGLGLAVHASATYLMVFGFQGSVPVLLRVLQAAGSCYLLYLGFGLLTAAPASSEVANQTREMSRCFLKGFLTNLSNPKCFVFCAAVVSPLLASSEWVSGAALLTGVVTGVPAWFALLSLFAATFAARFPSAQRTLLNRICGVVLIGFGAFGLIGTL